MYSKNAKRVTQSMAASLQRGSCLFLLVMATMLLLPSVAKAVQYGFLSIPATRASKNSNIELRLRITNDTAYDRGYYVDFYVDTYDSWNRITATSINKVVYHGTSGLVTAWWNPVSFSGSHNLLYKIEDWTFTPHTFAYGPSTTWPVKIINTTYKAPATPPVTWIEPGIICMTTSYTKSQLKLRVDEMHNLGMDTIVIAYPEDTYCTGGGAYYPSPTITPPTYGVERGQESWRINDSEHRFHVIQSILEEAKLNGQKVIMGLGRGPWTPKLAENYTSTEKTNVWNWQNTVASEIWALYGKNGSVGDFGDTLYGWFISTEGANFNSTARDFYNTSANNVAQYGLEKPVMISPCPMESNFSGNIAGSSVSIFAFQDAVGSAFDYNAIPPTATYDHSNYTAITINALATQYSNFASWFSGTGKHFWAMSESWRQNSPTGAVYAGDMYNECAYQYMSEKSYVTQNIFNEFLGCMKSSGNTTRCYYTGADTLYNNYLSWYDYYKDQ